MLITQVNYYKNVIMYEKIDKNLLDSFFTIEFCSCIFHDEFHVFSEELKIHQSLTTC